LNKLYFGDNLDVLRESIKDESVDLIYLDPPFNSNATYNVLFAGPKGHQSHAQIEAFEDTWHWGPQAEKEFSEILSQPNTQVAEVMRALRQFLGENDMMAYLTMMANRLLELRRVLTPTGTLYLHCDPTASHYLKVVLDGVFGHECFLNEIIWKRTSAHSSAKRYGPVHDVILFYGKGEEPTWNEQFQPYDEEYLRQFYTHVDPDGRVWRRSDMTGAGVRHGETGLVWRGIDVTAKGRHWAYPPTILEEMDKQGKLHWPRKEGGMPMLKRYLDEQPGVPLQDVWSDVRTMHNLSEERLGYPTQKPLALLERIICSSSNVGDVVLDPFCGCGTAVHAAQKLGRQWIGIDVTHLAITLIEKRLRDAFPAIKFEVHGTPKDLAGAGDLALRDKYQFQWWACSLVNAQPYQGKKKGADSGIDGLIYFQDDKGPSKKIIVSVKGGENVGVAMVKDLIATVAHQKAEIGLFVTLTEPTRPLLTEAVAAGFYTSPANGAKFQKIQVLTIDDLLSGKARAAYPRMDAGAATFRKAQLEHGQDTQGDWLSKSPGGEKAAKKGKRART
jgi:adenine specific DNA methylase Mod